MLKVLKDVRVSDIDQVRYIKFKFSKGSYKSRSAQNLMAFDIETSNGWRQPDGTVVGFDHDRYNNDENYRRMIDEGEAMSLMYVWQIAIESENKPVVFMGRTWEEFDQFMSELTDEMRRQAVFGYKSIDRDAELFVARNDQRNVNCKIYIHNLGFEFQHLRNLYNADFAQSGKGNHGSVSGVFARQTRKPMKCSINKNRVRVEFRDSLVLTQKSLKSWCKDEKLPVQKLSEPKDYYLEMRTPETPLTDEEIQYSINDVVSMLYGLEKYREKYVKLSDIPLTQTGAVRIKCRERVCQTNTQWANKCAEITKKYTPDDFKKLCQLFQGGWTHANNKYVGMVMKNVVCFDFASSYPAVMTTRTYPIGEFKQVDVSNFDVLSSQDINNPQFRWYAKIKVKNFRTCLNNTLWSSSKVCVDGTHPMLEDAIVDNGRIFSASEMTAYMTDLDYDTFKKAYTIFDGIEVLELYRAESGYLCKEIITTILEYFAYKTSLKGDPDAESLYNESKQFVNSIYGCSVTKLDSGLIQGIPDLLILYKDKWATLENKRHKHINNAQNPTVVTGISSFTINIAQLN